MKHTIRANRHTVLKKEPVQSTRLSKDEKVSVRLGKIYEVKAYEEAPDQHIEVTLGHKAGTWFIFEPHWSCSWLEDEQEDDTEPFRELVSRKVMRAIMPNANQPDIDIYTPQINRSLYNHGILTRQQIAMFLAQIAHESGEMRYKEEIASGAAYEGRKDLGNIHKGDGVKYKGRGFIQLTGRANYELAERHFKQPLIDKPQLITMNPYLTVATATWFWERNNINVLANKNDFEGVTRRINGGTNGYGDRLKYWVRAKEALGLNNAQEQSVNWSAFNSNISQYFTVGEATNYSSARIPKEKEIQDNILMLAKELDKIRYEFGVPIYVTSWYRPPAINAAVGGARFSKHLTGMAVDIKIEGDLIDFQEKLDAGWFGALGYGARKGFVHLDMRNNKGWRSGGHKGVRWNY